MRTLLAVLALGTFLLDGCVTHNDPGHGGPAARGGTGLSSLTRLVDPLIGTIHGGNVFPGASMPHGMVQWSPDTSAGGLSMPGGYNYGDTIIRGFSLTHLSGAGCAAFENIPFMPVTRPVTVQPQPNGSPYSARFTHAQERAIPGYYAVRLGSGIAVRLSVTDRTGIGAFTYPAGTPAGMIVNPASSAGGRSNVDGSQDAALRIGNGEIDGWATAGRFCNLHNRYTVYFAARFNRPFVAVGTWNGGAVHPGSREAGGPLAGGYVTFDTARGRTITAVVGLSYVSVAGARLNLAAEERSWSVAAVRERAAAAWGNLLNRIQIGGGTPAQERVFYSALYHALLQPTIFSDVNGRYPGFDGRVHTARGYTQYTNFSGWDIYRSEVQLLAWLLPRETSDMMQSLVADARQGGWFPKWPVANAYTGEMNGDSAAPILADAYAFGARRFEAGIALRYAIKGASRPGAGPGGYQERPGLEGYLQHGFVPPQTGGYGAAATTLEYAVDDFAISQLARFLREDALYKEYRRRAENWRTVFDPAVGLMAPRTPGGAWLSPFNPNSMTGFVEGNAWQYTWMVPQNLPGLFGAMGGNETATRQLDRYFERLNAGPTAPFHWAGNEPGFGAPWEYDFAGKPWRTQAVVRRIETELYAATPGGLPGNDDLGAMSSWYVWAAIGLYPEIPGVAGFALGSPLFPRITVNLPGGHHLAIDAPGASTASPYVQSLRLDGRPYSRAWLPLSAVSGNASLRFRLGGRPNTAWGTAPAWPPIG